MAVLSLTATPVRFLKNTAVTLTAKAYSDGVLTDIGTITIGIVDQVGNTVVAAGTAVTDGGDGTYTYALAAQTSVNQLTVTWTESGGSSFQTFHAVDGRFLFTTAAARTFDNSALASTSAYPTTTIEAARRRITAKLEQWTGRSWVPTYRYGEFAGTGDRWLGLRDAQVSRGQSGGEGSGFDPIQVISGTINGTSITAGNVQVFDNGYLYRKDGLWSSGTSTNPLNVKLGWEYGMDNLVDGVDRIGLLLLRDEIVSSNISDRTSRFSDELGTYTFVTPGQGRAVSNVPEVNEWVMAHDMRLRVG